MYFNFISSFQRKGRIDTQKTILVINTKTLQVGNWKFNRFHGVM